MDEANHADLCFSLAELCTELHRAYGNGRDASVIVLFDEYDRLLTIFRDNEKDQARMIKFLQNFFEEGLKGCDAVFKCVIMGSLPVAHQAFILPNNFRKAYNMFENEYAE